MIFFGNHQLILVFLFLFSVALAQTQLASQPPFVLVDVGRRRRTSVRPTVGIVEIVYGSIFFHSCVHPMHS
jgi:hypothetical protein